MFSDPSSFPAQDPDDLPDAAAGSEGSERPGEEPDSEFAPSDQPDTVEIAQAILDSESQKRLWIKTIVPLLQLSLRETDFSVRVQFALDQMHIAACERITRILRADLPAGPH